MSLLDPVSVSFPTSRNDAGPGMERIGKWDSQRQ